MAEVITLAKMPQGRGNKIILTEQQIQFYKDNNATMNAIEISKQLGISTAVLYGRIKELGLPKKINLYQKKPEPISTELFDWDNAKLIDPIMF
jgi:predicted DNA-binding transcriptional regulator AlpA